ncbi:MAG: 23S rRNA (uracil(1939)-C(5))-methyltransferase RlmD [Lysobacterales bacterium]
MARRNKQTQPTAVLELDIVDLIADGRGVARVDGKTVFVAGALAGERVQARLTARHRQFDEAETVTVLQAAATRVMPACAHFGVCGGCVLQHLNPAAQIAAKQKVLLDNLQRIGEVTPETLLPAFVGEPWGYRRRGRLSVRHVAKKGRTLVGFREHNGKYVADIKSCAVLHPSVGQRIERIAELVEGLQARESIPQIEFAVADRVTVLVFRHLNPLSAADLERLIAFAQAEQIAVMLQPGGNDSVHALWPEAPELDYALPDYDLRLAFRPLDFIQVNGAMNQRMIETALTLLDPQAHEDVLDLFCGLGNFTLPLARRAHALVGVEGEHGLVERARENARANGIANAEFFVADLIQDQRHATWAGRRYHKLLLDPARAGADQVLAWLPLAAIERIVYVSCHPGTLARDAGLLVHQHGFRLHAAGVMDMFPHTAHVESIAVFER